MQERLNQNDVTNRVNVEDPVRVRDAVLALYASRYPGADLAAVERGFADFKSLFEGRYPGYLACDTLYHDMRHTLDMTLATARLVDGHERTCAAAEHRAARPEAVRRRANAVVAVDQARHGERHVQRMAHVVIQGVAGEIAGVPAAEQGLEVGEAAAERRKVDAGIARCVQRHHRIADPRRILDVDAIGHVVLVKTVLHFLSPEQGIIPRSGVGSKGVRPLSRVL